ncbi:hypothetical protein G9A89_007764 [Geosiphon pyriformis]|nr:hypothetical protein G9A89_007764 [Geosiphon pyriformis]
MKKTPVREIDNFPFTIDEITISVKVLVMDAPQYQALVGNDWLQKANTNLNWETQELTISYQEQHTWVPATCDIFNKCSKNAPAFEFELEEEKSIIETFMALGSISNWADKTEQHDTQIECPLFKTRTTKTTPLHSTQIQRLPQKTLINGSLSKKWDRMPCLTCGERLPDKCDWIDVTFKEGVLTRGTSFNAAYNSALNKLYYYPHDAEMIFDLAMALINRATQKNLKQMNIKLCEKYIIPCNEQWCPECYALSISLPSENNKNKIKFEEPETTKEIEATLIYLIENQLALQLKYFNNRQGIKLEKTHEIDAGYDLRYSDKDTLVLKPKSLTKINFKIALKIPPGAIVQIASQFSLASKRINIRGEIINAEYTGDITVILQNKTDKPFKIEHAEKIAQAIYLLLINISEHHKVYTCKNPTTVQQIFESNEQICLEHNISIPNIYVLRGAKKVRVTFYNPNHQLVILLNKLEIGVIYSNIFQQEQPQTVLNFSEIIEHSLPKISPRPSFENYHVVMKKLSQINMEQLEPHQQKQLKELIAEFANIFAKNNNDLGRTDLVQHQIYTGNAKPRQQQAY